MPIPTSKSELIEAIETTYGKLKIDLQSVPIENARLRTMPGHAKETTMSPCNLLAYLIGWGELVLKWNRLIENQRDVVFPKTGFKWTDLGQLAQKFYGDYEELDYTELLARLDKTVSKILSLLEKKTNKQIYGVVWYKQYTMGRMVQLNTAKHLIQIVYSFSIAQAKIMNYRQWQRSFS